MIQRFPAYKGEIYTLSISVMIRILQVCMSRVKKFFLTEFNYSSTETRGLQIYGSLFHIDSFSTT